MAPGSMSVAKERIACFFAACLCCAVFLGGCAGSPSAIGFGHQAPSVDQCLPEQLHPVSRSILDDWLAERITTAEFRRTFHLPNSDYLSVSECLLLARQGI